jgi:hypothetical protein
LRLSGYRGLKKSVDDTLLYSPKDEYIDEVVIKLKAEGVDIEKEDSMAGLLGVHIDQNYVKNEIRLTQTG